MSTNQPELELKTDASLSITDTDNSLTNSTTSSSVSWSVNPLMLVNDLVQHNQIKYQYELIHEEGPAHNKLFHVTLVLGDETYKGKGASLRQAQKDAANIALEQTQYERPLAKESNEQNLTPTVLLNNIGSKLGIAISYDLVQQQEFDVGTANSQPSFSTGKSYLQKLNASIYKNNSVSSMISKEDEQISGPFRIRVMFGEFHFYGFGHTIQAAKHDAAYNAIKGMKNHLLENDDCSVEGGEELCKAKRNSLKSPVSQVHEVAQQRNTPVEFSIIGEAGPSHKRVFTMECRLGQLSTVGEGRSKKESKQAAAIKMLEHLSDLPLISDSNDIINGFKPATNKKKKNKKKIIKSKIQKLGVVINDILESVWSSESGNDGSIKNNDKKKSQLPKKRTMSAKEELLKLGNLINVQIQFTDLSKKGDNYFTLLSLGIRPPYICLGEEFSQEKSVDNAAFHGIKFLYKNNLLDNISFDEKLLTESYFTEDSFKYVVASPDIEEIDS